MNVERGLVDSFELQNRLIYSYETHGTFWKEKGAEGETETILGSRTAREGRLPSSSRIVSTTSTSGLSDQFDVLDLFTSSSSRLWEDVVSRGERNLKSNRRRRSSTRLHREAKILFLLVLNTDTVRRMNERASRTRSHHFHPIWSSLTLIPEWWIPQLDARSIEEQYDGIDRLSFVP